MAVKADWGTSQLDGMCADEPAETRSRPKVDPFESGRSALTMLNMIDSTEPVGDVTLETPPEELHRMLSISIKREGRLFDRGVTCDLKECGEVTCLACPFNEAHDDESDKQTLCRIGMEQEILSTFLIAQSQGVQVGQSRL